MKILQINAVYNKASTGRTCKELHDFLTENGHKCITVYGGPYVDWEDTLHIGNVIDYKFHALLSRISGKVGYYSLISTMKLIQYIKYNEPDIVHLRVLHSNFINIPLLLKFLGKEDIPTVVTLHDCFFSQVNVATILILIVKNGRLSASCVHHTKSGIKVGFLIEQTRCF